MDSGSGGLTIFHAFKESVIRRKRADGDLTVTEGSPALLPPTVHPFPDLNHRSAIGMSMLVSLWVGVPVGCSESGERMKEEGYSISASWLRLAS